MDIFDLHPREVNMDMLPILDWVQVTWNPMVKLDTLQLLYWFVISPSQAKISLLC